MRKMIVILLAMLLSAGILGAACAEALPAAEQTADWLSNDVLMTFFDHSMFVGDSQMAVISGKNAAAELKALLAGE